MRLAVDGDPVHAKFQARRDLGQGRCGAFAAGQAVGDQADMVAAVGLAVGDVEDMAKNSADRRAHRVQDTKRLLWSIRHGRSEPAFAGRNGRADAARSGGRHQQRGNSGVRASHRKVQREVLTPIKGLDG